jgi:transcriptional regulator with XRE-family HTH domain
MPRQVHQRMTDSEANLARRIAYERDERGLSYEALADAMTQAGCPMQGMAIHRIEKGSPRRRVTVDELVTFSAVLGIPISELLMPLQFIQQQRAKDLALELYSAEERLGEEGARMYAAYVEYFKIAADNPDLTEYIDNRRASRRLFSQPRIRSSSPKARLITPLLEFREAIIGSARDQAERELTARPKRMAK